MRIRQLAEAGQGGSDPSGWCAASQPSHPLEAVSRKGSWRVGWGTTDIRRGGIGCAARPGVSTAWAEALLKNAARGCDGDDLMMDYLNGATDNEIAVIGCLAAMVGSLGLMLISGSVFGRTAARGEQSVESGRVRGEVSRPVGPKTADQEAA